MPKKNVILNRVCFFLLTVLWLSWGVPCPVNAEMLSIQGTPLEIHAFEDSTMGVFRWQDSLNNLPTGNGNQVLVQQYYNDYPKGSVIFLNGDN